MVWLKSPATAKTPRLLGTRRLYKRENWSTTHFGQHSMDQRPFLWFRYTWSICSSDMNPTDCAICMILKPNGPFKPNLADCMGHNSIRRAYVVWDSSLLLFSEFSKNIKSRKSMIEDLSLYLRHPIVMKSIYVFPIIHCAVFTPYKNTRGYPKIRRIISQQADVASS